MRAVALSRPLPICSRQSSAAVCGIPRFSRPGLASHAASRTYHACRACCAANDELNARAEQKRSAGKHPLAIERLRNLAPDVPHTFFSRSTSPYFNLAVEHHLLTYSHPSSRILFTYANTPCVIIGRNQNPWVECDIRAITKGTSDGRHVELIRRRSGGGTVFHDEGNLNYTVIVPGEGFERRTHVQMVVDALVALREKQHVSRRWHEVRVNERNDIVARLSPKYRKEGAEEEWFKVSGTAFKLTRGRALHHGTLLHSSPYVDSIGTFLRSPGKEYITAKGVESVRSPVTNLWKADKERQRRDLTFSVRKTVERMWAEKYAVESTDPPVSIQTAKGQPEDLVPELMAGIHELRTQAWRWHQTPGYSFDSGEITIGGQSLRLGFEVKNGLVQSVKTSEELQRRYEQLLVGKSVHELSAPNKWQELLTDGKLTIVIQNALIKLLETCFPPLKNKDHARGVQRNSEDGVGETQEPSRGTLTDNEQHFLYGGRVNKTDKQALRNFSIAVDRLERRVLNWSIPRQRLAKIGEKVKPTADAEINIKRMGSLWPNLVFDDLTAVTERVNISMIEVREIITGLLKPSRNRALYQLQIDHQPLLVKLDETSSEIHDLSLQLTKILTRYLIEERKGAPHRSVRVGLYDDDEGTGKKEQKDSDLPPGTSTEGMSNAQKILDATLAMIDQQDGRGDR